MGNIFIYIYIWIYIYISVIWSEESRQGLLVAFSPIAPENYRGTIVDIHFGVSYNSRINMLKLLNQFLVTKLLFGYMGCKYFSNRLLGTNSH